MEMGGGRWRREAGVGVGGGRGGRWDEGKAGPGSTEEEDGEQGPERMRAGPPSFLAVSVTPSGPVLVTPPP